MTIKEKLLEKMSAQCGQKITEINLISWDMIEPYIDELEASQLEPPVKPACESLQKRFDIYASAINAIDDFFEYRYSRYSPKQIKEVIMRIIDNITEQLSKSV